MLKKKQGALTGDVFHLGAPFLLRVPNIVQLDQQAALLAQVAASFTASSIMVWSTWPLALNTR